MDFLLELLNEKQIAPHLQCVFNPHILLEQRDSS